MHIADNLCNPKWNHGSLAIFLILIYVLRFIKATPQPKFQLAMPNGSQVLLFEKCVKCRLSYFPDQNWNGRNSGLPQWNQTKYGTLIELSWNYWLKRFFRKILIHNCRLAANVKFFRSAIVNIQVLLLHGASIFWEKIFIVSETRTYLLSFSVEKCLNKLKLHFNLAYILQKSP